MTVRTRIAPSPTGAPHIGTAYIALFNLAFARRHGGSFILRIEDTDRQRSSVASETEIINALHWLGIAWDEGPDTDGPHGPYRQSERTAMYRDHVAQLWHAGQAYPCFCTPERLQAVRDAQVAAKSEFQGYDRACAGIAAAEARRRVDAGETHVFRLRSPVDGECRWQDRLRGEIVVPWAGVDDQVLLKSDGYPTYHLANVVDDHLMAVSHVIRGEEWISSTPKHVLLYRTFGWQPPELAHLPLLRNPDRSKLSKRKNPTSILYYREAGFLPEVLLNFLGLVSYSFADGREDFTLTEFIDQFDLNRISLGGPVFDIGKLREFNARRLRALSLDDLFGRFQEWRLNQTVWTRILQMAQPRLNQLTDLLPMSAFLFADRLPDTAPQLQQHAGDETTPLLERLRLVQWEIENTTEWTPETVRAVFDRISVLEGIKLKKLLPPFFIAICGAKVSLPLFDSMLLLGRDLCLRRILYAIEDLESAGCRLSKKQLKALQSRYRDAGSGA